MVDLLFFSGFGAFLCHVFCTLLSVSLTVELQSQRLVWVVRDLKDQLIPVIAVLYSLLLVSVSGFMVAAKSAC